jgi:hypothetical protein
MIDILLIGCFVIFGISSIVFLVVYIKTFNNFLRVFRETHLQKWNELGGLQSIRLEFHNKRARTNVDRWIKEETDEKYIGLKNIYSRVSRLETIAGILIIMSVVFFILHLVYTGKL